jgi:predicted TIM-barrel fold metal-dependent hydrolase
MPIPLRASLPSSRLKRHFSFIGFPVISNERSAIMSSRQILDIHCHLFNARFAVMELAAATWNHLQGDYPHAGGAKKKRTARGIFEALEGVRDYAAWIARLAATAVSDCESLYQASLRNFAASRLGKNAQLFMAPLMMDIYFALSDNADEEAAGRGRRAAPQAQAFAIPAARRKDFDVHFEAVRKLILAEMETAPKALRRSASDQALAAVFDDAKKELLAPPPKTRRGADPYAGIEMSPGYRRHLHDLEALAVKYPGQVFPFLAADPRRAGMLKLVKMKVKEGRGLFKGIKLYPPLGYLPTHPNLAPVFDYCEQHGIPVTLHCSPGGLNNFRTKNYVRSWAEESGWQDFGRITGNKSAFYTAPEKWLPVLDRWKKLRINFAHLGGGDQLGENKREWMNRIIYLVKTYDNVYTDVSYHARENLPGELLKVIGENPRLADKLMFGTDYIMIMLDPKLGGLTRYFDHFENFPDPLLCGNAKRFLNIADGV